MRRRPPDMSFTRFTYSFAMSLKMSLAPHEPCILITTGDWATEIIGAESAAAPAAPAAPVRNLRRVTALGCATTADCLSVIERVSSVFWVCMLAFVRWRQGRRIRAPMRGLMLIPGIPHGNKGLRRSPQPRYQRGIPPGGAFGAAGWTAAGGAVAARSRLGVGCQPWTIMKTANPST